jgi:hypothetical protein
MGPTPGCVINCSTSGRFLASCSTAFVNSAIFGSSWSSSSNNSFRRRLVQGANESFEILQTTGPYELSESGRLYPVYVRGEVYLATHQGGEAAAEFQKILGHRGIVLNSPIGVLAHLQLGRAYAMQGDTAKTRATYQDFLTLWNDADRDIPIIKQAKSEYTKLQ